jgi:peptidoglycan/xylan/chitin deacetylase (PgdA/CDA1 family)
MMTGKVSISKRIQKKLRTICRKARTICLDLNYALLNRMPKTVGTAKGLRILVYHGICDDQPWRFNSRYLSRTQFEEHLQFIGKLYHPVSLQDVVSGNLSVDKLNVLLTFDDGLKNNFTHAFPLLKQYKIPAVFFVTAAASTPQPFLFNDLTDVSPLLISGSLDIEGETFQRKKIFLNQRLVTKDGIQLAHYFHKASQAERARVLQRLTEHIPEAELSKYKLYYELMNEAELKEISDHPDYEIGAHGFYHTDLSALSEKELEDELQRSADYLKRVLNKDIKSMAFPYGNYNQAVIDACEKQGFRYLFRTEKEVPANTQAMLFERFTVNPFVSALNQMHHIAKNNYE